MMRILILFLLIFEKINWRPILKLEKEITCVAKVTRGSTRSCLQLRRGQHPDKYQCNLLRHYTFHQDPKKIIYRIQVKGPK